MLEKEIYLAYGVAFSVAGLATIFASPIAIRLANRFGIMDNPNQRKVHKQAIPRLGGLAIFGSILFTFIFLSLFSKTIQALILPHLKQFLFLGGGATLMFVVGLIDDIRGVSPRTKMEFQIVASLLVYYGGFHFLLAQNLSQHIGITYLFTVLSFFLTVFWTVGTTNAVNLIDGLDGLASGITGIALVCLGFISVANQHTATALAAFIIAGASFGFLWHNRHPAKIFLGDSGSLVLGFLLSTLTIEGTQQGSLFASLVGPLCLLYIPLLDTVLAMVRRSQKGLPFSFADNFHIHHRLLRRGIHHPHVVLILWAVTLGVGGVGFIIPFIESAYRSYVVNTFAFILLALTIRYLANLELFEYILSLSKINRRKQTPRSKILALRKQLVELENFFTADALLHEVGKIVRSLEMNLCIISMTPLEREDQIVTVYRWEDRSKEKSENLNWNAKSFSRSLVEAKSICLFQTDSFIKIELEQEKWKMRRLSEDSQLWSKLIVEKLAQLPVLRIFCPSEPQSQLYSQSLI